MNHKRDHVANTSSLTHFTAYACWECGALLDREDELGNQIEFCPVCEADLRVPMIPAVLSPIHRVPVQPTERAATALPPRPPTGTAPQQPAAAPSDLGWLVYVAIAVGLIALSAVSGLAVAVLLAIIGGVYAAFHAGKAVHGSLSTGSPGQGSAMKGLIVLVVVVVAAVVFLLVLVVTLNDMRSRR